MRDVGPPRTTVSVRGALLSEGRSGLGEEELVNSIACSAFQATRSDATVRRIVRADGIARAYLVNTGSSGSYEKQQRVIILLST